MSKMWGGRFSGRLDPHFEEWQRSLPFDRRLLRADLTGSAAWARALGSAGVLSKREVERIETALRQIGTAAERDAELFEATEAEDVHSFVEEQLGKRVGAAARKLHTGRSRNDQVATDLKLYLRDRSLELEQVVVELIAALVELADRHADLPMPGYTHLQRAQPITAGHHTLAYVEMLARDRGRLLDARDRMDTCPLGSAALAGTAFAVDRRALAKDLGFRGGPTRNSLDAVSDRDHVCELAFCCSTIMLHLSRLAEDWIFFASHEAGFLSFSDDVATGSSLMPQKKNPDAMELIRGKTGRVTGHLLGLFVTLKGLPMAYNRDLQEDKEALFDAIDTTASCLRVLATATRGVRFEAERCAAEAARGYLNATDLADLLVARGVPFRDAHERTGLAVREALERGVELEELPADTQRELLPELDGDLRSQLTPARVLARRRVTGGTAPARVVAEVKAWKRKLDSWQK